VFFSFEDPIKIFSPITHNELGYTTLSVAEPAAQALASARLLAAQEA